MKESKIILALVLAQILYLFVPQTVFCQTESLEGVQYTPPKGWVKTQKQGAAVFTVVDKTTNAFCVLTVYGESVSAGTAQQNFANQWNELVVKPFKADPNPKTETKVAPGGLQGTAGGAEIDFGGVRSIALLTVFTGFGRTASVLTIFNDQTYLGQMQTFIDGIKLDTTRVLSDPTPTIQNNDPFPDRPGYTPQKPLMGTLKSSITMADLVGTWDQGAGSVQTYIDSYTGNYAGTNTSFYGEQYSIRSDGSFDYKFVGRSNNNTTRESDSGIIILSGGFIAFKFKTRATQKYQFIAYMTQPNGAAILSLVGVHDNFQGYDAAGMSLECGHGSGYIHCVGGEEWARLGGPKPAVVVNKPPDPAGPNTEFLDFDPFPDKPYVQAQQPLTGRLRKTITAADLAGTWEIGGATVMTYVSSSTQQYTSASFFGKKYFIRADGSYNSRTQARASNTTIRETDTGTVVLSGGFITMRSNQNPAMRYQFVADMILPNGAAVLSLIYLGESPPLDANALRANCGHAHGYITCLNGEEWVRIP